MPNKLLKAVNFAAEKHKKQRRKDDGSPYINHPLGVAQILDTIGGIEDEDILIAAILHDTIEDTQTTEKELREIFGDRICDIVIEVTDDKSEPKDIRKMKQVEKADKISREAKLVKMADKLHNLRDHIKGMESGEHFWEIERVQGYFIWSYAIVKKMAEINSGLEKELMEIFSYVLNHIVGQDPVEMVPEMVRMDEKKLGSELEKYYQMMRETGEK